MEAATSHCKFSIQAPEEQLKRDEHNIWMIFAFTNVHMEGEWHEYIRNVPLLMKPIKLSQTLLYLQMDDETKTSDTLIYAACPC